MVDDMTASNFILPDRILCDMHTEKYWLETPDILHIMAAITGIPTLYDDEYIAGYYEDVIATYGNKFEAERKLESLTIGNWTHHIVNCSRHPGLHWVLICTRFQTGTCIIMDPLNTDRLVAPVQTAAAGVFGKRNVSVYPTGIQQDSWRCGYICMWWALSMKWQSYTGQGLNQWACPETPPREWEKLVWHLLGFKRRYPDISADDLDMWQLFNTDRELDTLNISRYMKHVHKVAAQSTDTWNIPYDVPGNNQPQVTPK
jgi:hypothetical protein